MRRLSTRLVAALGPCEREEDLLPAVGAAIEKVRGRPVKLRAVAFPPETASGVWIDHSGFDILAFEQHTDPGHQLVILGHETWHMFQGHCSSLTAHGTVAARAQDTPRADALTTLLARLTATDTDTEPGSGSGEPAPPRMHIAMRTGSGADQHEEDAEFFGVRFATSVQAAVAASRAVADTAQLAGRIEVSMAHRRRRT
ncbi:toxin-antitoxin system, toxin component [Streptomyces sp. NPDC004610]|uniref:toxin-antitoxin system, toxin component n=1 Tax=unclassified Streptomyces TaxID=2593676 RepID=UPI0033AA41D6